MLLNMERKAGGTYLLKRLKKTKSPAAAPVAWLTERRVHPFPLTPSCPFLLVYK